MGGWACIYIYIYICISIYLYMYMYMSPPPCGWGGWWGGDGGVGSGFFPGPYIHKTRDQRKTQIIPMYRSHPKLLILGSCFKRFDKPHASRGWAFPSGSESRGACRPPCHAAELVVGRSLLCSEVLYPFMGLSENGAYLQFIAICGYSILNGKGDQGNNPLELGGTPQWYAPMVW